MKIFKTIYNFIMDVLIMFTFCVAFCIAMSLLCVATEFAIKALIVSILIIALDRIVNKFFEGDK